MELEGLHEENAKQLYEFKLTGIQCDKTSHVKVDRSDLGHRMKAGVGGGVCKKLTLAKKDNPATTQYAQPNARTTFWAERASACSAVKALYTPVPTAMSQKKYKKAAAFTLLVKIPAAPSRPGRNLRVPQLFREGPAFRAFYLTRKSGSKAG